MSDVTSDLEIVRSLLEAAGISADGVQDMTEAVAKVNLSQISSL